MPETLTLLALIATIASVGTALACFVWFRRVRLGLAAALKTSSDQHVQHMNQLINLVQNLQHKQKQQEQQIGQLADANIKLRQELAVLVTQLEAEFSEPESDLQRHKFLH